MNPRALLQAYSLSRGAPSTTWVLLQILSCFANFHYFTSAAYLKGRHCESRGKEARNCQWQKRTSRLFALHTRVMTEREINRACASEATELTFNHLGTSAYVECFAILTHKKNGVNYFFVNRIKIEILSKRIFLFPMENEIKNQNVRTDK